MKKICMCLLVVLLLASVVYAEPKKNLIAVNLQDVELANVVKFISDATGKNFIFDETLKGRITIIAPSKISADEAFSLFTSVLNLKGYTLVPAPGNLLKIVPSGQAKSLSPEFGEEKATDAYITKLIPLSYISAENALKFFQPLISKEGHISVFGTGNYLLLVENALNIQRIEHILSFVDQPLVKDDPEIYPIKNGVAEDMAKMINDSLQKKDKAGIGGDDVRVMADTRLNALILIGSSYAKESIKKLIALLDVPQLEQTGSIKVYFLENADATELSKVLDSVVKGIEEKVKLPPGQDTKGKVIITADKATNSLIINAPAGLYQNLLGIIKDLDKRRKQVYVEAMIVEASLDKLKELGSKWRIIAENNGEPVFITGFGTMDSNAMVDIITGLAGFSVGGMGNFLDVPITVGTETFTLTVPGFSALFSLNEFRDAINVLSTPQILTSDNKEAEIIVGENVPFLSKRESDPARPESLFSVIERKDVGITLKLTPQITEGEYVKLDIYQEISALKQESNVIVLAQGPTTTKRSTKTSVVVKDNQTVVISGLMQEKSEEIITKVPLLGDIPFLGYLFKFKSYNTQKTNLLVFLTPHVIRDSVALASLSNSKKSDFTRQLTEEKFGEAVVKLNAGVSEADFDRFLKQNRFRIKEKLQEGLYLVVIPGDKGFMEIKDIMSRSGLIEHIEPNLRVKDQ
ncbi:MAG: gspD [Nitrospirae bacterium]|nr:gspD [Nitrospirota bacterium]